MRNIVLGVAVSLDGFIEGPKGEYDWCFGDQDYGMSAFMERIDTIFYGRKSYKMAGGNIFPHMKAFVFSNTLTQKDISDTVISGNLEEQVATIKKSNGKDIWLFGGAELTTSLMNAGLVDELWLSVHPILLGSGKPLFQGLKERVKTTLIDSKPYNTGLTSLRYKVEHKNASNPRTTINN